MWNNKITRLSIILGVLVLITLFQLFRDRGGDRLDLDRNIFSVVDTAAIEKVQIDFNGEKIELTQEANNWKLGEDKLADEYYVSLLKAVLSSVEVNRRLSAQEIENWSAKPENTAEVRIESGKKSLEFSAGGNEIQTQSYFMDKETGESYLVSIPGYRSFISAIFMLSRLEWEDKTLFSSPWTAIQELKIEYPDLPDEGYTIVADNGFLRIMELESADTTKLLDYVAIFSGLKANYFFDDPALDSVLAQQPEMIISLKDINETRNNSLEIYPRIPDSNLQIGKTRDGQVIGFDYRNVQFLARPRGYFQSSK